MVLCLVCITNEKDSTNRSIFFIQDTERSKVIYIKGCIAAVRDWFKENLIIIGGIAVGLALVQVSSLKLSVN